jgi:glycerol-3-phosphate dehydrogenase
VLDLAVIGGGVNGAGIARDAAGRGLKVLLLEQNDLASGTSSGSTKLIHGGLRYLEYYQFRLVHEALAERELLLRAAPHIIRPLRFVLPYRSGLRSRWLIRLGLFLYDHIGGREILPPARGIDLRRNRAGYPLLDQYKTGFEYSDCWVDDARLVVLLACDAARHGAHIRTRSRCVRARRMGGAWTLTLADGSHCAARVLVNAAGPWVSQILSDVVGHDAPSRVRLVKGSHIVTRRLFPHDLCYVFQNADGRICFAIPYEHDFTLIGTTDEDYCGDPGQAAISEVEEIYLRQAASAYLRRPIEASDVVWRYSGVRALRDDGTSRAQEATRDYVLEVNGVPPLLSVFGGKITTHRKLAEAAMARLAPFFPGLGTAWTATASLPGGNFPWDGAETLMNELRSSYPFLTVGIIRRLIRSYGTLAEQMLGDARSLADLGQMFSAGLTAREVDWLQRNEWASTAEDILWRRSKLGLRLTGREVAQLEHWLARGNKNASQSA